MNACRNIHACMLAARREVKNEKSHFAYIWEIYGGRCLSGFITLRCSCAIQQLKFILHPLSCLTCSHLVVHSSAGLVDMESYTG